jgi:lysophospholipase L1-like esterase
VHGEGKMRLLFIGDSLIEYFDWQERFQKNSVSNMGVAGETVEGLYARLQVLYMQLDTPDAIFIMSGINNLAMGDRKFTTTYRKIVRGLKKQYKSPKIFVQSLLPVLFPWISNDEIRGINLQLKKMADAEKVGYLDIYSLFLDREGRPVADYLLEDGVHVSEKGYRVWSNEIEKHL